MNISPAPELFDRPLTHRQWAFLRAMRDGGGSGRIVGAAELATARACRDAGYATIAKTRDRGFITQLGRDYLLRLARAE